MSFNIITQYSFTIIKQVILVRSIFIFKMDKFQDLLTQAAQLKQSQLKKQRKNFQALPEYLKSGLNFSKKYEQLRKQHYFVQLHMSQKIKGIGNRLFSQKNYPEALSKYQEALSIFRYIHATKYQNLKDQDIVYENYIPEQQFQEDHKPLLVALYLNICSTLTKMNKKQQAIHSCQQALKLTQTAKGYYKKAQAYLQYINKDKDDIKLGFYYLNKSYQLSKDQTIIVEMHRIKRQIDQERQKQQKWFKFMFDKNKNNLQDQNKTKNNNPQLKPKQDNQMKKDKQSHTQKDKVNKKRTHNNELQEFMSDVKNIKIKQNQNESNQQKQQKDYQNSQQKDKKSQKDKKIEIQFQKFKGHLIPQKSQTLRLEQCKQKLKVYIGLSEQQWKIAYQEDFIQKNGSKIYSIIQLYNFKEYLIEYRSLLAKCLQIKGKIQNLQQKSEVYNKFFNWIFTHPIQKYQKYIDRYNIQLEWIQKNRNCPKSQFQQINQLKMKQQRQTDYLAKYQSNESNQLLLKQRLVETGLQIKNACPSLDKNTDKQQLKNSKQISKQRQKYLKKKQQPQNRQKQTQNEQIPDQVPEEVKNFLQDYGQLDKSLKQKKLGKEKLVNEQANRQSKDGISDSIKKDSMNFLYTFIVILIVSTLVKVIF